VETVTTSTAPPRITRSSATPITMIRVAMRSWYLPCRRPLRSADTRRLGRSRSLTRSRNADRYPGGTGRGSTCRHRSASTVAGPCAGLCAGVRHCSSASW
jgi:hypothetical protein